MLDEPVEQQVADALALHAGVDGDRADLGEVLPHDVERAAADHLAVELRATKNSWMSSYSWTVAFSSRMRPA